MRKKVLDKNENWCIIGYNPQNATICDSDGPAYMTGSKEIFPGVACDVRR